MINYIIISSGNLAYLNYNNKKLLKKAHNIMDFFTLDIMFQILYIQKLNIPF